MSRSLLCAYILMVVVYGVKRVLSFLSEVKHSKIIPDFIKHSCNIGYITYSLAHSKVNASRVLQFAYSGMCAVSMMNLYLREYFTIFFLCNIYSSTALENTICRFLTVVFNCWVTFIYFSTSEDLHSRLSFI